MFFVALIYGLEIVKFSQWLSLIILTVCLYILWQIRNALLIGLTAIIFAVVLNRGVRFLQRKIASRKASVLVLIALIALFLGICGAVIVPPFATQMQQLISLVPQVIDQIQNSANQLKLPGYSREISSFEGLGEIFNPLQTLNIDMLIRRFFEWFSNTLTVTLNIFLITILTVMMLLNPAPYRKLFVRGFPVSVQQRVEYVLDRCETAIAGWFIGILFNMTVIGTMSMVGLWVLGVPLALANGLLAGLLAFIPNVGPVFSVVPPAAIALLKAPWQAVAVVVLYVLIQQIESNVLTPTVMQRQVALLPAVTLLAQVVFAVFFGFLGLLLALPLTLILQNWLEEFWIKGFLDQY
ncbi:MAG: AI-2E family transporter [Nodosilinea sp.]